MARSGRKGEVFKAKSRYREKLETERDLCLNHCPHAKASECRWTPGACMALVRRNRETE